MGEADAKTKNHLAECFERGNCFCSKNVSWSEDETKFEPSKIPLNINLIFYSTVQDEEESKSM